MSARRCIATLACVLAMVTSAQRPARAVDLLFQPSILGQVRDGDGYFPGSTEFPSGRECWGRG